MRLFFLLLLLVSLPRITEAQEAASCVFCQIVRGEREVSLVYKNAKVMAFMDHAPLNPGHTLIVPAEHSEDLLELSADTAREMFATAQKIAEAIKHTDLMADSFQLQMNSGPMVQRVKHSLLHLWPRFKGDFTGSAGERLDSERPRAARAELNANARKIRVALELAALYDTYYEEHLKLVPFEATSAGDHRYNNLFPNILSAEYHSALRELYQKTLEQLRKIEREALPSVEQITYDTLAWECETALANLSFPIKELMPVNQFNGMHLFIPIWASGSSAQPFRTVADYEHWLKRLEGFVEWCDSAITHMRRGMTSGYVLPKALTQKVIPQLLKLATGPAEKHLFYQPVKNIPAEFSPSDRERLTDAYAKTIERAIIPAYASLHTFMVGEYLPASRGSSGIREVPRGKEFYELQVKTYTTTDLTADEIHELGKKEVQRILAEMENVKSRVSFEGNLREFFSAVRTKKELMPFTEPEQVIKNFNSIHEKMRPSVARLFNVVPKTEFEVRRTEAFREKAAAAQYFAGSLDGSRPGIFYVPIPDVEKYSVLGSESLFLHEAIPGHHFQVSLQRENKSLPKFRRTLTYSAFAEGWALYCESLGKELDLYEDPYQYFGMLSGEIHRAIRLVVDTGLHARSWTREQAIAYSLENEPRSEESITAEIERYMAWPGQALSYKIGELKIKELRARAEKELGEKFRVRDFHDQVLETGSVPLKVLEEKINRWIKTGMAR